MKPFIIWTLRRTGGTTLQAILEEHSGLPTIEHEPFLPGRVLSGVAEAHRAGDRTGFDEGVREILRAGYPIKHCFEVHPKRFSIDLADRLEDLYEGDRSTRLDEVNRVARFVGLDPVPADSELAARVVEREQSKKARAYLTNEEEFLSKVTRPGLTDRVLTAIGLRPAECDG